MIFTNKSVDEEVAELNLMQRMIGVIVSLSMTYWIIKA